MGIKGLTDRGPSLPQIGELRKGGEKPAAGNKPGADLKYFRFTSKHPQVERAFYDSYPDNPTAVNVYFPFQTADENFSAWVEEWGAGSLKWRGDGETLVRWQKEDGSYSEEPMPQPPGGKEAGYLKIVIPELKRLAYVLALTKSIHDIVEMSAVLQAYEAMRGDLRGIPFVLSRVPKMVSTPGADGKRVRREKWLWHLEAQPAWVQAQLSVMQRAALPTGAALLNNGDIADIETGEILDDDYDDDPAVAISPSPEPEPPADIRGETSPQAQAQRPRPQAPRPINGNLTPPMPTGAMERQFDALGLAKFGDSWDDERPKMVGEITSKRADGVAVTSSKELYRAEMQYLIDQMHK